MELRDVDDMLGILLSIIPSESAPFVAQGSENYDSLS
jgi:hypothetical protein